MDYAQERIEGGENFTITIGHSLFTIAEIEQYWLGEVLPYIYKTEGVDTRWGQVMGVLSSLVYSDRAPWFLYR